MSSPGGRQNEAARGVERSRATSASPPSFGSLDALVERAAELGAERALERAGAFSDGASRYYKRSDAPVEARAWDRAVAELAPEGKVFKPGREKLIRCDHLHAWIEKHAVSKATEQVSKVPDATSGAVPYSEFQAKLLRRVAR